jgi:NACHT domain
MFCSTLFQMDEGLLLEAPRRVLIEGLPGSGKTSLALRLLHSWATRTDPWLSNAIQIAILIPLRELRTSGQSLSHFIGKTLLPRAALGNGKDSFSRVWRRLTALEEKLLIVIDGDYDDELLTGEATDLLEGRLLPDARVVITMCAGRRANMIAPFVQRRVLLTGLQLNHVARLTQQYFLGKRIPDGASRYLDALGEESNPLRDLATWPLGWILLCVMFEEGGGTLPSPDAPLHEIYNAMFRCMVSRSLVRRGDSPSDCTEMPTHCKKLLAEFGKLALSGINNGCFVYQESDVKIVCRGLEVTELGFLTRGLQFSRGGRRGEVFHVIHPAFSEFLAAYYVSSIVHYANILQREMEEIPGLLQQDTSSLIPRILLGLLGRKGFLIFEQLCPLDVNVRVLFTLLQACGPGDANIAAACRLLRCTGVGGTGAQVVHTSTGELIGWGLVLSSPACPLQALELVVQTEGVDPDALDKFFSALAENESVKAVRISSLLGHELSANQVNRLAKYVALTVPKARLQTFELVITCVDESPPDR